MEIMKPIVRIVLVGIFCFVALVSAPHKSLAAEASVSPEIVPDKTWPSPVEPLGPGPR